MTTQNPHLDNPTKCTRPETAISSLLRYETSIILSLPNRGVVHKMAGLAITTIGGVWIAGTILYLINAIKTNHTGLAVGLGILALLGVGLLLIGLWHLAGHTRIELNPKHLNISLRLWGLGPKRNIPLEQIADISFHAVGPAMLQKMTPIIIRIKEKGKIMLGTGLPGDEKRWIAWSIFDFTDKHK